MATGYSFEPNADQATQAKTGAISPPFGSQGAVKTLNYQLPATTGAASSSALSPLVSQQRQGSGITSAVLQSVLRTVLGPDHANMILAPSPGTQGDSGRADNGAQDYAGAGAAARPADAGPTWSDIGGTFGAPSIHPGDDVPNRPSVGVTAGANDSNAQGLIASSPAGRQPVPNFGSDATQGIGQPGPGAGVPDFGGASMSRDWLTNRGGG